MQQNKIEISRHPSRIPATKNLTSTLHIIEHFFFRENGGYNSRARGEPKSWPNPFILM